jgi:uncharacterized protein Yka (UPF0111/DUF47 family)
MLGWFRALLPKEERFFDLYAKHSQAVQKGAEALEEMMRGGDETPVYCQRVSQFENAVPSSRRSTASISRT